MGAYRFGGEVCDPVRCLGMHQEANGLLICDQISALYVCMLFDESTGLIEGASRTLAWHEGLRPPHPSRLRANLGCWPSISRTKNTHLHTPAMIIVYFEGCDALSGYLMDASRVRTHSCRLTTVASRTPRRYCASSLSCPPVNCCTLHRP